MPTMQIFLDNISDIGPPFGNALYLIGHWSDFHGSFKPLGAAGRLCIPKEKSLDLCLVLVEHLVETAAGGLNNLTEFLGQLFTVWRKRCMIVIENHKRMLRSMSVT